MPDFLPSTPDLPHIAQIIQLAVAPVFLLAGLGAFLNVCVGRLARIVDRTRSLEPVLLASRGDKHDRIKGELHVLDTRIRIVNRAIFLTVLAAVLVAAVVILLFAGFLLDFPVGTAIALCFIGAMLCTGLGYGIFLYETRVSVRAVRVRRHLLTHEAQAGEEISD